MYSFIFTSKSTYNGKDNYLMHILLDDVIIDSTFIQVPEGSDQSYLDSIANSKIEYLQGLN